MQIVMQFWNVVLITIVRKLRRQLVDTSRRQLSKRSICNDRKLIFIATDSENIKNDSYFTLRSRGGLTVPSSMLVDFTCSCFAVLDYTSKFIEKESVVPARTVAEYILGTFSPKIEFTCDIHKDWGFRFVTQIIINIIFNNKQKISADTVRKNIIVAFKSRQLGKK